jgi:hypothetical protein
MQLKRTIIILLLLIQNSSPAQVSNQIDEVSKGKIINIENPSKKSGVYKYVFREGNGYGVEYLESEWYNEINKLDGVLKSGTNGAGEDMVFSNFSLYVDTVFMKGKKKFVQCYIINEDGFYDVTEKRFFISNLNKALSSGEIALTTYFYIEPYSIKHPIRAVERFIIDSSLPTLIKTTFIYSLIIIFLVFVSQRITINREVKMGLVSELDPKRLLSDDVSRYWLYRIYENSPKLGKMMWDWKADETKLLKGNLEYLKKYNLKDQEQVQYISDLIAQIFKIEDNDTSNFGQSYKAWHSKSEALLLSTRNLLKESGLSTAKMDTLLTKYHSSPEMEKNLKLLINFLTQVSKK